jgi:hypothetical protein
MKAYWGSGGIVPRIIALGTRWRLVVSFTLQPLYYQGKNHGIHPIGGWVATRPGLDAVVKRKIPNFCREWNSQSSSPYPSACDIRNKQFN